MDHVVETQAVSRSFGRIEAVRQLDLAVRAREVFGLLGPNGAGKTTSVRMIGATLLPSSGRILVCGSDTAGAPDEVKRVIGYMAQKFSLYGDLTVRENLRFFAALYGLHGHGSRTAMSRAVELTDLAGLEDRLADALSGGQKQLLALGVAIVHHPKLLILDEPTAGLDPMHRQKIWDLLYLLAAEGTTILVTTHGMDEAERCQRLGFINRGRLLAVGTPRELKKTIEGRLYTKSHAELPRGTEAARRVDGVAWAHPHQGEIRICLKRDGPAAPAAVARALGGGSLDRATPGLEDVFYDLATGATASEDPA